MAVQLPAEGHESDLTKAWGFVPAFAGGAASAPVAHVPEPSLRSSPWKWPALSSYCPPAAQLPAEGHETETTRAEGSVPAFAGRLASTPVAHVPELSLRSSPCKWPALSSYCPTAPQLPAEGHESALTLKEGFVPAFAGSAASPPGAHVPALSLRSSP